MGRKRRQYYSPIGGISYMLAFLLNFAFQFSVSLASGQSSMHFASSYNSSSNPVYFLLNPSASINIFDDGNLVLNSNIILQNDISGKGDFVLSSQKDICLNANMHELNALKIKENTEVQLEGHLTIMRRISLDRGRIILGNYNLVLGADVAQESVSRKNIDCEGFGRLIFVTQKTTDTVVVHKINYIFPRTIGYVTFHTMANKFSLICTYSAFPEIQNKPYLVFPDVYLPPPK